MRQAFFSVGVIRDEQGGFVGFNLGSDHCAEHEWGIPELTRAFGLDTNKLGIPGKMVTELPEGLSLIKGRGSRSIIYTPYADSVVEVAKKYKLLRAIHQGKIGQDIVTAWAEAEFLLKVSNKLYKEIDELWAAFQRKDVAIWIGGGNPFGGHGLVLAIASKVPADKAQYMYDCEHETWRLNEYMKQTGIEDKLKSAGCGFHALRPAAFKNKDTGAEEIRFFLNPMQQRDNNYGWFSLAELEAWARGEGPIPMDKAHGRR